MESLCQIRKSLCEQLLAFLMTFRTEAREDVSRSFDPKHRAPRGSGKRMREHAMRGRQHKPRAVEEHGKQMKQPHPPFGLPSEEFDFERVQMFRTYDGSGAVVMRDVLIHDESAIAELRGHRRARLRRRMLDVRPVDVLTRELEVGLDRCTRIPGTAAAEDAEDEDAVTMKMFDRVDGRVAERAAAFADSSSMRTSRITTA